VRGITHMGAALEFSLDLSAENIRRKFSYQKQLAERN
jgi:hypothetical protein